MSVTVFHRLLRGELPSAKIYEDAHIYAFMDAFPQSKGHALIIGKKGAADLLQMDDDTLCHIIRFSRRLANAQEKVFRPDGIRVMQLNGAAAGQSVFYYHMHLLPIWANRSLAPDGDKAVDFATLKAQADALTKALPA